VGIYVGKDRLTSCRRAAEAGFDIAVLDDGFQHRRLARDFDIVLYSSEEKVALREPRSALRRSDILLVKAGVERNNVIERLRANRRGRLFTYSTFTRSVSDLRTGERVPLERLAKMRLLAFCGIARPGRFAQTLRDADLRVVSFLPFPDHHPYPPASREKIVRACRSQGADALVTTGKDAVKLADPIEGWGDTPVYVLEIGLTIEPGFDASWRAFLEKRKV
jgi:tetraacyldisaccharide 4'-kinase